MLAPNPNKSNVLEANPRKRGFAGKAALWGGALAVAAIYLFATRPATLADGQAAGRTCDREGVPHSRRRERRGARALDRGRRRPGPKAGLKFHEKWRDADVQAGPLPALFLRESATAVQKSKVPLGLFSAPTFRSRSRTGLPARRLSISSACGQPATRSSSMPPISGVYTAMFADYAVAPGCVSCHNELRSRRRPTGSSRT